MNFTYSSFFHHLEVSASDFSITVFIKFLLFIFFIIGQRDHMAELERQ